MSHQVQTPDPLFTKFSQFMWQDPALARADFISPRTTSGPTGVFKSGNKDSRGNDSKIPFSAANLDVIRGPKGVPARIESFYGDTTFRTQEKSLEESVPDKKIKDARKRQGGGVLDPEREANKRVNSVLLTEREIRVANLVTNPATFTNKLDLATTTQWDDPASDPFGDIETAREAIADAFGKPPNKMLVGSTAWARGLKNHPDIADRVKFVGNTRPAKVMLQHIAELFDLDEVVLGEMRKNTANLGATGSLTSIWGENVILFWGEPPTIESDMLSWTAESQKVETRRYAEDRTKGRVTEVSHEDTELLVNEKAAFLFFNTIF